MRHILLTFTALTVFTFGMSASMAQQPQQMDPGTIKVNPTQQPSPAPTQTQPSTPPNLNTSKNPYRNRYNLPTQPPVQTQPRR